MVLSQGGLLGPFHSCSKFPKITQVPGTSTIVAMFSSSLHLTSASCIHSNLRLYSKSVPRAVPFTAFQLPIAVTMRLIDIDTSMTAISKIDIPRHFETSSQFTPHNSPRLGSGRYSVRALALPIISEQRLSS